MTDVDPSLERLWHYRFTRPDGTELDAKELDGDQAADAWAHELSKSTKSPVVIHRNEGGDDWKYITEVDDRP
jgi:hypothetical protein